MARRSGAWLWFITGAVLLVGCVVALVASWVRGGIVNVVLGVAVIAGCSPALAIAYRDARGRSPSHTNQGKEPKP